MDADLAYEVVWAVVRGHGRWTRGSKAGATLTDLFEKWGGMVGAVHKGECEMATSAGEKACTCEPWLIRAPGAQDG